MAIEGINDRPPYVIWEMRPVEDRNASIAAGHIVEKDVAFAVITRPGSRDTLETVAEDWLNKLRTNKELPPNWYPAFKQSFDSWQKGETAAVDGTPIKGWSVLGAGAQKTLISAGIMSVEDLANTSDQDLQNVGTGAMSFKLKAKAWLESAAGPGKAAEKAAAQDAKIADLMALAEKQAKAIEELKAKQPVKA
jgi:hypothetical protein